MTDHEQLVLPPSGRPRARHRVSLRHWLVAIVLLPFMVGAALAHSPHDVIDALALSPQFERDGTVFIASSSHLLRSRDGGYEWNELSGGLDNQTFFSAIVPSPGFDSDGTVYISTFGDGVYKSTDRGDSWQKTNNGLPDGNVTGLAISPGYSSDGVVLAVVQGSGLFRSGNGGGDWRRALTAGVEAVGFARGVSSKLAVAGDAGGRLYRSTDSGGTWDVVESAALDGAITSIAIAAGTSSSPGEVFVGTASGALYRSTDAGQRFERLKRAFGDHKAPVVAVSVSPDYANDRSVIVSTGEEAAFISIDGGANWKKWSDGLTTDPQAHSVKYDSPSFREAVFSGGYVRDRTIYLAGFDGLFVSTDAGQSWNQAEVMPVRLIKGIATGDAGKGVSVVGLGTYGGGGYFSRDGGNSWVVGNQGLARTRLSSLTFSDSFAEDRTIYSGAYGKLLKSIDGGESWTATGHGEEQDLGYDTRRFASKVLRKLGLDSLHEAWFAGHSFQDPYPTVVAIAPDEKTLFFGTRWHGIYRSDDAGETSEPLWDADGHAVTGVTLSPDFANDRTVFATVRKIGIVKSTDGGESWEPMNEGLTPVLAWRDQSESRRSAMDVRLALPDDFDKTDWLAAGTEAGLHVSPDGGETWTKSGAAEVSGNIEAIAVSPEFASTRTLVINVKGKGIYISRDAGNSFVRPSGGPIDRIRYLAFSPLYASDETIYAASDENLYRSTDGGAGWSVVSRPARYENIREPVRFTGTWKRENGGEFSGLSSTWSDTPGDRVELRFVGTGATWIGGSGTGYGRADVYIDGERVETVDLFGEEDGLGEVYRYEGLDYGPHVIAVVVADKRNTHSAGNRVSVDAFDIAP